MATITDLTTSTTAAASMPIINTNFDNLNTDKAEISGQTYTGLIEFTGTTHAGIQVNSLTTVQRDALTPANGMVIYNTTDSAIEFYENGTWVELSGASDASTTVKGISEEATEAEVVAGTTAGGTGARLFVNPSSISAKILTDVERTFVRALTADATEINQLDGTTNIAEADTFFGATDITGSEAETLSDGSNADALHVHTYAERGTTAYAATTVGNTTTETALLSFSLGANELGTTNAVEIYIPIDTWQNDQNGQTTTFRLKYGSTTVANVIESHGAASFSGLIGYIKAVLYASGATGTQYGTIQVIASETDYSGTSPVSIQLTGNGTGAEDSTGALTLSVTVQHSDTQVTETITARGGKATIIK